MFQTFIYNSLGITTKTVKQSKCTFKGYLQIITNLSKLYNNY
jgi:hypothetical protein